MGDVKNLSPDHYTATAIEPIAVIEAWKLNFLLGNAIKYIARADHKGQRQDDLMKAANYLYRAATGRWLPDACEHTRAVTVDLKGALEELRRTSPELFKSEGGET